MPRYATIHPNLPQATQLRLPDPGEWFRTDDSAHVFKIVNGQLVAHNLVAGKDPRLPDAPSDALSAALYFNESDVRSVLEGKGQAAATAYPEFFQQPQQPQGTEMKEFTTPSGVKVQAPQTTQQPTTQPTQPTPVDPKIQQAQQEIHKAQELQAKVNQMLVKQGKPPVPIPPAPTSPQTSPTTPQISPQNAPGQAQGQETTPSTTPPPSSTSTPPQSTTTTPTSPPQAQESSMEDQVIEKAKKMLQAFGITMPSMNQSPTSAVADIYKQFSEMNNLSGTKKDIEDLINKQTQEIANVNENPWMSEGLRQRKVQGITDKYQQRLNLLQTTFNRADEDARFLTGKYLEQVHQTQQNTQDIIFKGIDLAEKEISARRAERKDIEHRREFDVSESRREARDVEKTREFESKESRLGKEFAENQARLRYEFDKREADKAKKEQKVSDHQLNQKIQHIFDAKAKGESADDLKKEIDEAVITDAMRDYLKRKVDNIYGVSGGEGGGFTFGKLGKKLDSLFRYGE